MCNISETLAGFLESHIAEHGPIKRVVVAYSGGVDSSVLLHAAAALGLGVPVVAIHVNHQLNKAANSWQRHCQAFAHGLGVAFITEAVTVINTGRGLEDEARRQRYLAIERHVSQGDAVLCAHHGGDQLETFFLRLMRGAGVDGLSGIKACRPLGAALLARPFLGLGKDALLAYARQFNVQWIEDDSNRSDRFDRNFLRRQVLPPLLDRWPKAEQKVRTAAAHLDAVNQLLDQHTQEDYLALSPAAARLGHSVKIPEGHAWSRARVSQVLRYWLRARGLQPPTAKQLEQLHRVIEAKPGQQPLLRLGKHHIRRYKERLYCVPPLLPQSPEGEISFHVNDASLALPDGSILSWHGALSEALGERAEQNFKVKFRQAGLRCHPHHRHRSQSLKKLLQEYELEPWLRSQVPLIYAGDRLLAVGGLWLEAGFANSSAGVGGANAPASAESLLEFNWCYP